MSFNDRVKQRRKALKLTQQAVADKVGISRSAVNSWEMGDHIPGGKAAMALPKVLQCSWEWLETGRGSPEVMIAKLETNEHKVKLVPLLAKSEVISYLEGTKNPDQFLSESLSLLPAMLNGSDQCFAIQEDSPGMTPRIIPGELVIIDPANKNTPTPGGEWAFDVDGHLTIGVAKRTPRGIMLSFYNNEPGWESVLINPDSAIGRVVMSIPSSSLNTR